MARPSVGRAPAVVATALALALVNAGLAILIVSAVGAQAFAQAWLGPVLVVLGAVAAAVAVRLWRDYLRALRQD